MAKKKVEFKVERFPGPYIISKLVNGEVVEERFSDTRYQAGKAIQAMGGDTPVAPLSGIPDYIPVQDRDKG